MSTQSFREWFGSQLKSRDWSAADFHRKSGVPRPTVYTWVAGTRLPDPGSIDLIADVFGLPVDDVLTIAGHRPATDPIKPGDPRDQVIARTKRVRWNPDRLATILSLYDHWAENDRKAKE